MEIIRGLEPLKTKANCAVTIGTFDGVHRGHLQIIEKLKSVASAEGLCTTLVTFDPHPRLVVGNTKPSAIELLTTIDEKIEILQKRGVDRMLIIPFDRRFASIHYEDFLQDILIGRLGARALVIGYDHAFGKGREGNFANLEMLHRKYNYSLTEVEPFEVKGQVVSSTLLRQFLRDGDVALAGELFGRYYSLSGTVVSGSARGKKMNFPTANLVVADPNKMIPANGVYAVDVLIGSDSHRGMLNIGHKPTFYESGPRTLEVHIFEFDGNIYNNNLTVFFKKRLRDEKKFDNKEALMAQLEIDKQQSLAI